MKTGAAAGNDVAFFQAGGMVLALWDRGRLAEDSAMADSPGWGGVPWPTTSPPPRRWTLGPDGGVTPP